MSKETIGIIITLVTLAVGAAVGMANMEARLVRAIDDNHAESVARITKLETQMDAEIKAGAKREEWIDRLWDKVMK